ncbi:MAG: Tol-Pal system protein TolB [Deltaproteobacteria bacterium]|jgi:hypothetical protein|nr:Tol-Pal system protein TolB [Deltaproteobacteria bacterium]
MRGWKLKGVVFLCSVLFAGDLWASERVFYAIRYESLQRYPDIVSTKIYSLNPDGKDNRLVFSDENISIMLLARRGMPGHPGEVIVSSRNKIFAHAVEKRLNPGRWYPNRASIYELSADGSNGFRKIIDVQGEQSPSEIFANPQGDKVGYINYVNQKTFIFIHETQTGKLLHRLDVSRMFLDCFASLIGWLPDGERIFFTLDTGDVHVTSEESYKQRGTYFLKTDGTGLTRLPEEVTLFPLEKGKRRGTDSPPQFIREMPDGSYLFRDIILREGDRGTQLPSFLYLVNPLTKSRKGVPLEASKGINWFKVSPTGRYLAFTEKLPSKEGRYEWVEHLWSRDLISEKADRVFTFNNVPFNGHHLGLIGWIENRSQ